MGRFGQRWVSFPWEPEKGFHGLSLSPGEIYVTAKKRSERLHLERIAAEGGSRSRPAVPVPARRASSRRDSQPGWHCASGRGHRPPPG